MIIRPEKFTPFVHEGLSILDFTEGLDTELSIARICVTPQGQQKRAVSKSSDKYYYVLYGKITFSQGDITQTMKAGELCVVQKGQMYAYVNDSEEPVDLLLIQPGKLKPELDFGN